MKMKKTWFIVFCVLVLTVGLSAQKTSMKTLAQATADLPVGIIVTYGGDLSIDANLKAIKDAGWLLCDGTLYNSKDYPELFVAIGTANGGDASGNFNVPDLRDRFIRGTNGRGNVDPDAASRVAAAKGGAVGNNVGSLQTFATSLPHFNFTLQQNGDHTHACYHLSANMHMAWNGSTYRMARWNAPAQVDTAGAHLHTLNGYDSITEPISMALYFIIKAKEPQTPTGIIPGGSILAFGGSTASFNNTNWLFCNGMAYGLNLYPEMAAMISCNYGGDGVSVLNVPDFRGYFLRGTSHTSQRDPDAATRYELNTGGNKGDQVGSAESFTTIKPNGIQAGNAGAHTHNIALVPQTDHHAAKGASGPLAYNTMEWTGDPTTSSTDGAHSHSITGGDKENRPTNLYFDYLITDKDIKAAPPIGSIIAVGCDIENVDNIITLSNLGWLPCDGGSVSKSKYSDLYALIGNIYGPGSTDLTFKLPDLRGYFVKGAGGKSAIGQVLSKSTTGAPNNPIITTTNGDHQHTMYNIPTDTHVIDVVVGWDLAENNPNKSPTTSSGDHTHTVTGGDSESRPVNVNVDYIIRYK